MTLMGTLSIAATVMAYPVDLYGSPSATAAAVSYRQAQVLQPGSRGDVVEV